MAPITKSTSLLAVVAVMIQPTPAPFVALIPEAVAIGMTSVAGVVGAAGTVAGSVAQAVGTAHGNKKLQCAKRVLQGGGRPQEIGQPATALAWQICKDQLQASAVHFSGPSPGDILVSGIPTACMTLLTNITGKFDEGDPIVEGTDSALFTDMPDEDIQTIQKALDSRG